MRQRAAKGEGDGQESGKRHEQLVARRCVCVGRVILFRPSVNIRITVSKTGTEDEQGRKSSDTTPRQADIFLRAILSDHLDDSMSKVKSMWLSKLYCLAGRDDCGQMNDRKDAEE